MHNLGNKKKNLSFLMSNPDRKYEGLIVVLTFILNCFFVLSYLTPEFSIINPNDGAKYIESGRQLLIWGLRDLSWGPLVAFVYAPIYLFVGNSFNWFMLSAWIGNIILFGLMWFSCLLLVNEFKNYVSRHVLLAVLFLSGVFITTLGNQADALFVAMSCFALTKLLQYYRTGEIAKIIWASIFLGLGVLSRVESILLLIPLIVFSIIFRDNKNNILKLLISCVLPVLLILSVFVIASYMKVGNANLGLGSKSFDSLTHTMNMVFVKGSKNQSAYLRGEPIFGDIEQHQNSVLRAIFINPVAIIERIIVNISNFPKMFKDYFGSDQSLYVFFFSVYGIYSMIKNKDKRAWLLFIWPLHSLVSLVFLPIHIFPQTCYLFVLLSGFGITRFLSKDTPLKEKFILLCFNGIILVFSTIFQLKLAFATNLLLVAVLLIEIFVSLNEKRLLAYQYLPAILLLIGGVLFGNSYVFPNSRLGKTDDEKAVHFMMKNFPKQANVISYFPKPVIAAKLNSRGFPDNVENTEEFVSQLCQNDVYAIYVDESLPFDSDLIDKTVQEKPDALDLVFISDSEKIKIFEINNCGN